MSDAPDPVFPPEIEEIIFSLAVQADWSEAKNLLLVSKHVHQWLLPQFYRVVVFHYERVINPRPKSNRRNLIHHGKHVRHLLLLSGNIGESQPLPYQTLTPGKCLAQCPNVVDLVLWTGRNEFDKVLLDQLLRLHLTHLSLDFGHIKMVQSEHPTLSVSLPTVTHLELIGHCQPFTPEELKECFPNVTHIALYCAISSMAALTPGILELWKDQMEVVILFPGQADSREPRVLDKTLSTFPSSQDPRVVIVQYGRSCPGTWYDATRGGLGMWGVAEEALTAERLKRQGITSTSY